MKKEVSLIILLLIIGLTITISITGEELTGRTIQGEAISGEAITGKASSQPTNVSIFVTPVVNTAPILGTINSTILACETDNFLYRFNATDTEGDNLTITINPEDPFYISFPSSFTNGDTNISSNIISGALSKTDAGGIDSTSKTHNLTISITDNFNATCCYDKANTSIIVIERNNPPSIESIGVQTIWTQGENNTLYRELVYSDTEFNEGYGQLFFNLSIINITDGALVDYFNITTTTGIINFSANTSQVGVYNVSVCINDTGLANPHINISSVCGQDGNSISACNIFSLTITDENRAPNITSKYPFNLTLTGVASNTFSFNISKHDPDGTIPDTYWYIDGAFAGLDTGSLVDEFAYSFGCGNSGEHNIKVEITDGLLNQSITWDITLSKCPEPSPPTRGGGGSIATIKPKNFTIDREEIHVILEQGNRKVETITVTNHEETNLSFKIINPDLKKFISLNPENFTLEPGEEKMIIIEINAWDGTPPDLYIGKIEVNGQGTIKKVLVSMEVESKKPAFDVRAKLVEGNLPLTPGEEFSVDITIFNIGSSGTFEVTMVYVIMNERGDQIFPETEIVIVTDELNFIKRFKIPKDSLAGRYVLYIRAIYGGNVGSTSIWFSAEDKEKKFPWLYLAIILAVIIIQLIFLIIWMRKKKKKREEQKIPYGFRPTKT